MPVSQAVLYRSYIREIGCKSQSSMNGEKPVATRISQVLVKAPKKGLPQKMEQMGLFTARSDKLWFSRSKPEK